jgi:HEAT repeat protein
LGAIGPKAADAVGALGQALHDPDRNVRHAAAKALGKIGPEAKGALDHLTAALQDRDRNVRSEAAYTMALLGPDAEPAVPALEQIKLREKDGLVRGAALHALSKIRGKN